MQSVHQFLRAVLQRLARNHGEITVGETVPFLSAALDVREVRFLSLHGEDLPRDLRLRELVTESFEVILDDVIHPRTTYAHGPPLEGEGRSRFQPELPAGPMDENQKRELFIREFNRLQSRNDFMWAGYVVRELLPRIGYALEDTKNVLNNLRTDRIVNVKKVANPRNPDFPATGVQLNLDHPHVRTVLGMPPGTESEQPAEHAGAVAEDALTHDL